MVHGFVIGHTSPSGGCATGRTIWKVVPWPACAGGDRAAVVFGDLRQMARPIRSRRTRCGGEIAGRCRRCVRYIFLRTDAVVGDGDLALSRPPALAALRRPPSSGPRSSPAGAPRGDGIKGVADQFLSNCRICKGSAWIVGTFHLHRPGLLDLTSRSHADLAGNFRLDRRARSPRPASRCGRTSTGRRSVSCIRAAAFFIRSTHSRPVSSRLSRHFISSDRRRCGSSARAPGYCGRPRRRTAPGRG